MKLRINHRLAMYVGVMLAAVAVFILIISSVSGAANSADLTEPSLTDEAVEGATQQPSVAAPVETATKMLYTSPLTEEPEPEPTIPKLASESDIYLIACTIWGEAEGVPNRAEQAAVAWCVLNRVDNRGKSIEEIVLAPNQFFCRNECTYVPPYFTALAEDVVNRWEREHAGFTDVGRTLPREYEYFVGDGWQHNYFSIEWRSKEYWDWTLPDPYP